MAIFVVRSAAPKVGVDQCFDNYVEEMEYRCDDYLSEEAGRAAEFIRTIVPDAFKSAMAEWWKARREQFRDEMWEEYNPEGEEEVGQWRTREDIEVESAALRKRILKLEAQVAAYKGIAREAGDKVDRLHSEGVVRECFIGSLLTSICCPDCQRERGDWFR